jgi:hypothetical protein
MWSITILINCLILFLFWVAGFTAISPAYNHFVQYAQLVGEIDLPILTQTVFSIRLWSLLYPAGWLLASVLFLLRLKKKESSRRAELVQLHTSASIFAGLLILVIFFTAGILPFLKIGVLID